MFTIASASSLLTPESLSRINHSFYSETHGGIKVYCTGNPYNVRTTPITMFLKGTQRIRPVDYIEPGKKYWGKYTKTCAIFVDGDSALVPHEREELLSVLAGWDSKGKKINGVDFLIGTVYIECDGGSVVEYPMNKYRIVYFKGNHLTIKSQPPYYNKGEEMRYSVAAERNQKKRVRKLLDNMMANMDMGGFGVLISRPDRNK